MIGVRPRFTSHLKKHMIRINKNIYIGASDPRFHEKVLKYMDPSSPYYEAAKRRVAKGHLMKTPVDQVTLPSKSGDKRTTLFLVFLFVIALLSLFLLLSNTNVIKQNSVYAGLPPAQADLHKQAYSPLDYVGANFVRTALIYYIELNGQAPLTLEALTRHFPDNYLSFIPIEAISRSNTTVPMYDGQGGWVYNPLATTITEMFYPNVPPFQSRGAYTTLPFEPVTIDVYKKSYAMTVMIGPYVLESMSVGLGKENRTPETTFIVKDRALEPRGTSPHAYGAAGLGFGDYAIHGTNDTSSIGTEKSMGCIRMTNEDVRALFPLIPKGALVRIHAGTTQPDHKAMLLDFNKLRQNVYPHINENGQNSLFDWLG